MQLMLSCLGYTDDDSIDCTCCIEDCEYADGTCFNLGYCIQKERL